MEKLKYTDVIWRNGEGKLIAGQIREKKKGGKLSVVAQVDSMKIQTTIKRDQIVWIDYEKDSGKPAFL